MLEETAVSSAKIMERMEATLGNLEQMSYDTINTTDQLVTLLGKAREYNMQMRDGTEAESGSQQTDGRYAGQAFEYFILVEQSFPSIRK